MADIGRTQGSRDLSRPLGAKKPEAEVGSSSDVLTTSLTRLLCNKTDGPQLLGSLSPPARAGARVDRANRSAEAHHLQLLALRQFVRSLSSERRGFETGGKVPPGEPLRRIRVGPDTRLAGGPICLLNGARLRTNGSSIILVHGERRPSNSSSCIQIPHGNVRERFFSCGQPQLVRAWPSQSCARGRQRLWPLSVRQCLLLSSGFARATCAGAHPRPEAAAHPPPGCCQANAESRLSSARAGATPTHCRELITTASVLMTYRRRWPGRAMPCAVLNDTIVPAEQLGWPQLCIVRIACLHVSKRRSHQCYCCRPFWQCQRGMCGIAEAPRSAACSARCRRR